MTHQSLSERHSIPTVFTAGFRLYFLAAGAFALFAMVAWLFWLGVHAAGGSFAEPWTAVAPQLWHAHEMVYGYTVAVIAGFFLTAVPNWTGSPPARAMFVAGTGFVWIAGRLVIWFSGFLDPVFVALVDLAFVPLLGLKIGGNLLKKTQSRNLIFLGLLTLLFAGNLLMHLEWLGVSGGDAMAGVRLGLLTTVAMIAIIGGRVVPGFTRNALNRAGYSGKMPVLRPVFDRVGIVSAVLLALAAGLDAPSVVIGSLAAIAAVSNGIRFAGWRFQATWREPILWSMHLAFALLVAGYAALATAHLFGDPSEIGALHLLGVGAAGGMTLAIMTRAALGHTGRPLVVSTPIAVAYASIALAAVIRACGPALLPDHYYSVMFVSGGLWLAAFTLFLAVYLPVLAFSANEKSGG
ncbi:NnrS family protein [Rhizobiales bacterium]|uniref:NnrS family protein n=1 Tax=Hongsoonwoonella zoysiae TaxID=2821844 RepID=UPI00156145F6|nr:NnrS family protein [Hongsoonwoonella zoysiae]NRG18220.1 NnrS family protein [Hongsoonwoonella zoysiae]